MAMAMPEIGTTKRQGAGLPDARMYQNREKFTKQPQNIPNVHNIFQLTIKYTEWP
jgi:hypothetical protein